MMRDSRSIVGIVIAGLLVMVFASCSSDSGSSDSGGGSPPCTNCSYWDLAFGGVGRYPAASGDPLVIAFSSTYVFPAQLKSPVDRDSLGLSNSYNIWIARREAGAASDTVWYYRVTSGGDHDFSPSWSPDGETIAFERNIGNQDKRQVFIVDVLDFENPGTPLQVTERTADMFNSMNPSWVVLGTETWISFATGPKGGGDADIAMIRYPGLDSLTIVSLDPADFARDENGVMSYVFDDQKPAANGTRYIVFASPNRLPVGDFEVLATTEEQSDSSVACAIFINGKDSNQQTPYTFRYRPAGIVVTLSGELLDYCVPAVIENFTAEADTVTTAVLDFVHMRGTLGVGSLPGGMDVYINDERMVGEGGVPIRTPVMGQGYAYVKCVVPGETFTVSVKNVFGTPCGDPVDTLVTAGDTTFVTFSCEESAGPGQVVSGPKSGMHGAAALTPRAFPVEMLAQGEDERSIWLIDLGDDISTEDDRLFGVESFNTGSNSPVLSPDSKYIAYFRGNYTSWEIVVADVSMLVDGTGDAELARVGLPGSTEDIECWRKPEKLSWLPLEAGRKIVASLSPCRGGEPADYSIYIADLEDHLP